jgi:hypothetical protein
VQVRPLWDDCKQYTGHCRYGAPLGGMRAAIAAMDRRRAAGQAREDGLAGNLVDHLQTELNTIAGLGVVAGQNRLKRDAVSQTVAAKDPNDDKKPSFTKRAAVNCAIWAARSPDFRPWRTSRSTASRRTRPPPRSWSSRASERSSRRR